MFSVHYSSRIRYEEIKKYPQKTTKIKPFIDKYSWKGIHFLKKKISDQKFEKNNVAVALSDLYPKKRRSISYLCFKT